MYSARTTHQLVYASYQMMIITTNFYCKYAIKQEFVYSTLSKRTHMFGLSQSVFLFFRWWKRDGFVPTLPNVRIHRIDSRIRMFGIWNRWEKYWSEWSVFCSGHVKCTTTVCAHIICNKERHTQIYSWTEKKTLLLSKRARKKNSWKKMYDIVRIFSFNSFAVKTYVLMLFYAEKNTVEIKQQIGISILPKQFINEIAEKSSSRNNNNSGKSVAIILHFQPNIFSRQIFYITSYPCVWFYAKKLIY